MEQQETSLSVQTLNLLATRLNRSFYAAVISILVYLVLSMMVLPSIYRSQRTGAILVVLLIGFCFFLAIAGYIWYVVSIGITTRRLEKPAALYILWLIAAPLLALLPIPVVSIIIGVSPLSIKYLISNEIQAKIRLEMMREKQRGGGPSFLQT